MGDVLHGELGHHQLAALALAQLLQRHVVGQRFLGDDHPGGVGAGMARNAFHAAGRVNQIADGGILGVDIFELGVFFQRLGQRHAYGERHQPRHAVDVAVGHAQRPPHVAQGRPRPQRPEGDDLGHVVGAVLGGNVADDLVAAGVLEVQVDIRHLAPLDVEKALENELVLQRVDLGDAQAVQHDAGGGAAAHVEKNIFLVHEPDDVPDHQEIVGELRLFDDVQFVFQAFFHFGGGLG